MVKSPLVSSLMTSFRSLSYSEVGERESVRAAQLAAQEAGDHLITNTHGKPPEVMASSVLLKVFQVSMLLFFPAWIFTIDLV